MVELAPAVERAEAELDTIPPGTEPTLIYRGLRACARAALRLFYRRIEVTGLEHIDLHTPTILASTHPNSIVDPVLVGLFESRQVTFCARDGLFRVPVFGTLLRAIGAVPIRRRSDHAGPVDNASAFAECRVVLARGGVISIFPEGKTHARMRVEPLRTGAARIALDAVGDAEQLCIVPVGLNYLVREAFRSDVHVAFGPPIHVREQLDRLERELPEAELPATDGDPRPRALVRALTDHVGEAMRELAVHIERQEDERLIAQVTAIIVDVRAAEGLDGEGQSPAERTALVRRVIDAYRWLETEDPVRCARLRTWVQHYLDERRSLGLGGVETALQKRSERRYGREDRSIFGPIGLLLGAPIAAVGLATVVVPYAVLRLLLLLGRPSTYRIALTKLLGGAVLFGGWFALLTWTVWTLTGPGIALGFALSLIPLGVFAHRYVIDLRLHRFGIRKNVRAVWQRGRFARLRLERRWLTRELATVRKLYLATHE